MQFVIHVVLSPHPDDAALSLGACMNAWRRRAEPTTIVTVFDGPGDGEPTPAALEDAVRYDGDPVAIRRREDEQAAGLLGAKLLSLGFPELVHRRRDDGSPRCQGLDDIYGPLQSGDEGVTDAVAASIGALINPESVLHVPLAIGGHVDHRIVRAAASGFGNIEYYEDQPYAIREQVTDPSVHWPPITEADIETWFAVIECYQSQMWNLFEGADWKQQFRHWLRGKLG